MTAAFRSGEYQEMTDLRTLGCPIQINGTFWNILKSRIIIYLYITLKKLKQKNFYVQKSTEVSKK